MDAGAYGASYALARGDILLSLGREDEALEAYLAARAMATADGEINLASLEQKLQALSPRVPALADTAAAPAAGEGG